MLDAIEAMRVTLGPGRFMLYIIQGLFHPAARVREVYWKMYNNMYVGAQDDLISSYPLFENEETTHKLPGKESEKVQNTYRRCEMELFI
jgi:splicing factor 3B subunit 1